MEKRLPLANGTVLQLRYKIVNLLGAGGMGAVYEAYNERTSAYIALKETFAVDDYEISAFEREAKLLANLDHEALPRVMDYFSENDGYFLVMELIKGEDLSVLLAGREQPFELETVISWADQILDALEDLHSQGIIHRDIKPANIKLTQRGKIKLIDFGLAKGTIGELTKISTINAATNGYAPLEQVLRANKEAFDLLSVGFFDRTYEILQQGTDERADIFALGATLYQLLTKRMPVNASTRALTSWSGQKDKLIPAREINSVISQDISNFLSKAMKLDRAERFRSASEMRSELNQIRSTRSTENNKTDAKTEEYREKVGYGDLPVSNKIIAIDLGSHIRTAYFSEGKFQKIKNRFGLYDTPNIISYSNYGGWIFGVEARNQLSINSQNSFPSPNMFLDVSEEDVRNKKEYRDIKFKFNEGEMKLFCPILDDYFSPADLLVKLLVKLKKDISIQLGERIEKAVVSIPNDSSLYYREKLRKAFKSAGLTLYRMVENSNLVGLGNYADVINELKVAVVDFGDTFDISILEVGERVVEVKSTNGDVEVGGKAIDEILIDWVIEEIKKQKIYLTEDDIFRQYLRDAVEKAKIDLSSAVETEINLSFINENSVSENRTIKLTRTKFEELVRPLFNKIIKNIEKTVKNSWLEPKDIDQVVITGSSAKIPLFQQIVRNIFEKKSIPFISNDKVLIGAVLLAEILRGNKMDLLLLQATTREFGIEIQNDEYIRMLYDGTSIPTRKSEIFTTSVDNQTAVEILVIEKNRIKNKSKQLGRFYLDNLPPAKSGVPQIEVTFDIDANSIVVVYARDIGTGKEIRHRIRDNKITGFSQTNYKNAKLAEIEEQKT